MLELLMKNIERHPWGYKRRIKPSDVGKYTKAYRGRGTYPRGGKKERGI